MLKRARKLDGAPLRTIADVRRLRDALIESTEGSPMPKPTVDQSKRDRQRGAVFAKGGDDHMFKKQAAGVAKSGRTGMAQSPAPGARAARGGGKSKVPDRVLPAKASRTGVR
jgi:hypothetical protein